MVNKSMILPNLNPLTNGARMLGNIAMIIKIIQDNIQNKYSLALNSFLF